MDAHTEQLQEKVKELETKIETLKRKVAEHSQTSAQAVQTFQTSLDTEKRRLDGFSTSYQNQMAADQKAFADFIILPIIAFISLFHA